MECAPIIISVYDRLDHLKKCIKSLQQNELARYSDLFVISDAAYKQEHVSQINEVRTYIKSISGFKRVYPVFREVNLGGHKSVLTAFHDVLQIYDSFISLEDDIVVSSDFLQHQPTDSDSFPTDNSCCRVELHSVFSIHQLERVSTHHQS